MQIKSLTLKNFRGFKDTEITFSDGLTVLVGVNGAGKSSVLDALAMLMSWAGSEIRQDSGRWKLKETDIHAGADSASIGVRLRYGGDEYGWNAHMQASGSETRKSTPGKNPDAFARKVHGQIAGAKPSVPVMVYYRANRAVTRVPVPPPPDARCFGLLETYANNLPAEAEDFRSFFEWFRAREDLENERRLRAEGQIGVRDRDMEAVRTALSAVLPEFTNPMVKRLPETLVMEKNGLELRVERLSDGEKLLIALVGDLTRRAALANPSMENPLHGEGVVLIDEIEQHLHPEWQRSIIGKLRRTFPNVQFIVSTHSPQVLGEVEHSNIRCIAMEENGSPTIFTPTQSLGLDANLILEELFDAPSRNKEVATVLTNIFREIDKEDAESLAKARREIKKLKKKLNGEIPDLVEAEAMLFMLENQ